MKRNRLENLVLVVIVLVVVQTFLEDFAVVADLPWSVRRLLMVLGFGFDLFFTAEFLVRLYCAALNRRASEYFLHQRGWIDFFASVPLAVLSSGPIVLGLLAGGGPVAAFGGSLNILKVVKAVRIARILRLLRFLKIFKQIKHADSVMAQRHIAKIAGVVVATFVFTLLGFNFLQTIFGLRTPDGKVLEQYVASAAFLAPAAEAGRKDAIEKYSALETGLLLVKYEGKTLYSRFDTPHYETAFGPSDYSYRKEGALELFFDMKPLNIQQSRDNLSYFVIILALLFVMLLYYSPHFAVTVTDPLHVMYRGFSEKSYNLEAKIPPRFREDDVYRLAEKYNEEYLPLKDRNSLETEGAGLELKLEDYGDIFKNG